MTLTEFLTELNNRIAAAKVSGFWTDAMKTQWINMAGERVCNFRRWKALELAKSTVTKADQEYYDYPDDFQENSIYYMEIDGDEYFEKTWDDYRKYKANESDEKIFASHDAFYFINPIPTEADLTLDIWGIRKWTTLVDGADEAITPRELNEPIIKLALATCLQKERRYSEAAAEIAEVEEPANPRIEGSGGILAKLAAREEDEGPKGHIGRAQSTRWM